MKIINVLQGSSKRPRMLLVVTAFIRLFCSFFHRSAICRASLESKTHTPVLVILAAKIHYHNIHRPRQTSCLTLVGHLNNGYISPKKTPTRFYMLEKTKQRLATINTVVTVWVGEYGVCNLKANPKETKTRRPNSCVMN